ncbi:MAG: hypothetical protein CL881_09445 [Dehalococcoidia bacterium]|nr:hypothetical protein [Dehalococcoidia bacterium]MAT64004.1 hypothetical protein [Dehalococcoidia bacterium]|tara:strand:- start:16621 stop:16833 length:213 start_codon:yes stop_codon:yes gene_type:complete
MKSKNYILMQIKTILMDRKSYRENKADEYVENIKDKTVYELLVLKKELSNAEEEYMDVSCRTSIWPDEYY